ncbi:1-phosphatidylinositol-3-phosphate 5-kinase [Malassezia japonica]|uniref:1-phosphatidylinositol-3-phosphate 5-kinase n=1 Tax=Malassezia japonica TaxID=223818 RepID=A0AAF0F5P9_9BASI|nr:1-phosphatidylinositol-3-phosphate 5-kinase [Malassezia japonica]WFD40241.1 1-phosphatidylinositol-3-phosphate 5-kinase [Malassezia japonica]
MAIPAERPPDGASLVSFNLLEDREERPPPSFAFASLFDRMRNAFSTAPERDVPDEPSGASPERSASPEKRTRRPGRAIVPLRTVAPSPVPSFTSVSSHAADEPGSPVLTEADSEAEVAQSVPGFPLSRDVLDDTRSLFSTPTPRSEIGDDTVSTFSFRPSYPSADAWIRRFRGEGLSRKYWMADETAKECRDCLLPFTPLRRRHHCRICGQIFCNKCCSNIVPGAKFGHEEAIRTCNQCLHMLEEYDRREMIDAEHRAEALKTEAASPTFVSPTETEYGDLQTPQSQFAATTLFSQDAHTLPRRTSHDDEPDWATVDALNHEELAETSLGDELADGELAPFRANLDADDVPPALAEESFDEVLPTTQAPEAVDETPADPQSPVTPRTTPGSPVRRSTARQKLMRGASRFVTSTALGAPSLVYFLRMLHQVLVAEHMGDVQEWKETVKLLALSVIERIRMRTRNTYLTDIRNFVKIKCMPGGRISDCEFLDGYICTKNVATKKMASFLPVRNARIMVVTFPLEYHRNANQLMSLEPIMAQEHEFIRILVARILDQRPNVVVAEKSVSYYALQLFEEAGVAVFWSMKKSSIDIIARCTQADIVSSIDRLALDPRLGRCACLSVDTYEFAHEPGRRKPLLRIEVTSKDVSSALVLRGASIAKLRRIKAILALMVFVGYNLKLEEHLRRDVGVVLDWSVMNIQHGPEELQTLGHADLDEDMHRKLILTETLKKYQRLILSASLSVILQPPYLVTHMKYVTDRMHVLRSAIPNEKPSTLMYELQGRAIRAQEETKGKKGEQTPESEKPELHTTDPPKSSPRSERSEARPVPDPTPSPAPSSATSAPTPSREEIFPLTGSDAPPTVSLLDPRSAHDETELMVLEAEHAAMQHSWKACVTNMAKMLSPFAHQNLVMLVSTTCAATQQICTGPALHTIEYYGPDDEPLGQFLERTCDESVNPCASKTCDRANLVHYTTYVHSGMRVQMVVERFVCPLPGEEKQLLCWSYCKQCERTTPVTHLSDEGWSFSFAKYLELQFYPNAACHPSTCQHDYYRDSVRYFALRNLAIRFLTDPIEPWEVVVPPMHLLIYPEKQYVLKNEEAVGLFERNVQYWDSVCARISALQQELRSARIYTIVPALAKTQARALALLGQILAAAHADCAEIQRLMMQVYWDSGRALIRMNDVRRVLQDKVVEWDGLFVEFEKRSTVSEREIRRLLAVHVKKAEESDEATPDTPSEKRMSLDTTSLLWDVFGGRDDRDTQDKEKEEKVLTSAPVVATPDETGDGKLLAPNDGKSHTIDSGALTAPSPVPHVPSPLARTVSLPIEDAQATDPEAVDLPASQPELETLPAASPKVSGEDAPLGASPTDPRSLGTLEKPKAAPRLAAPRPKRPDPEWIQPPPRPSSTEPNSRPTTPVESAPHGPYGTPEQRRTPKRRDDGKAANLRLTRPPNQGFAAFANHRGESMPLRPPWETQKGRPRKDEKRREAPSRSQVSSIARQFDLLSREAELERERQRRVPSRARRARPVTSTHATVEVFKSLRDAVGGDESDGSDHERPNEPHLSAETRAVAEAPGARVPPMHAGDRGERVRHKGRKGDARAKERGEGQSAKEPAKESVRTKEQAATHGLPSGARGAQDASEAKGDAQDGKDAASEADATEPVHTEAPTDAPPEPSVTPAPSEPTDEPADDQASQPADDTEVPPSVLFERLGETWRLHCGEMLPLAYPFLSSDHVFSDSCVVVREDEPSSIIAFTLNSKSYREQLQASQDARARTEGAVPPADGQSSAEHLRDLEHELRDTDGTHFGYEFDTGSVKLWCKIFFAEQFEALRHMYGCSESIVQSLSRCFKWDSGGGKSGSAFLKTRDDRLVVKQLSRAEIDGFSKFAPQYFAYVADCKAADRPTTLTKIFGYFRIGFRNAHTGKSLKLDVVVMENLVYGHQVYKIFDLKGSTRNRMRQETGRAYEVLMDENLVQMSQTCPILVREHSKRILRAALYNDSLFLTDMNVMDYSLIVVLDETRNELVIGIIDYLRTYTWDKRVESFVKETAILGGGGKGEPTIITPRQYRMRFLTFLDRYFLMTPDPWVQEGWVL